MNIYQDLEDSLYAVVSTLFPTWRIIFSFQNGPEPQTPYLCIDVSQLDAVGREQISSTVSVDELGDGTTTILQNYEAKVRFELIGLNDSNTTAGEMMHQLEFSFRTPASYELQRTNNLSLMRYSPVERLPLKRETDTYMFYQLDTVFGYAMRSVSEQDWIEATTVTGIYHDAGREPDHTIISTIEISSQETP
ncbi:hypothetical protein D3C85_607450 [compost metagenome]